MMQEILLWAIVAVPAVSIFVMALAGLDQNHHTRDYLQGNASPEHRDSEEPHDDSSPAVESRGLTQGHLH
ncbi:MAG TPA: hypothetical protein VLA67_09845 [Nitrospiraceae bacterium]|nr:hypothetical protein [Nitrospiraceae bacterium]